MKLWIARDEDGELHLFCSKPIKSGLYWIAGFGNELCINDNLFPEVTFENSPQEVEIKLVN